MKTKIPLILALCGFAAACGYHLRGTGTFLPPHIKTLYVPMFKNETTRFQLDLKLTQAVVNEFVARSKVEVSTDEGKSDAVLLGDIVTFNVYPIALSSQGGADRYNITVVARVVLRDKVKNRIIFANPSFLYIQEYEVSEGADFESMETEAIDQIAEKFARSLVMTMLEGF
ncbi:MAG: LPS assembly lipoprotein LptE [Candidatus Aminicenantes bacterium]|nr:LPS assembly lipoprotein LptE [Candidatus Aminicenantes bacterium]